MAGFLGKFFSNKRNPKKEAEKLLNELSPTGIKYGFRVSWPNGYYIEDVDNIILKLEQEISNLTKDNIRLQNDYDQLQDLHSKLKADFTKYQLQTQIANEIPDVSTEESLAMISKMSGISSGFKDELPALSEEELKRKSKISQKSAEVISHVAEPSKNTKSVDNSAPTQQVFTDLISPKKQKKNNGGN